MQSRSASRADTSLAAAWSVVPALVAWGALHLPAHAALGVLALTFVIHLAMDRWLADRFPVPGWYLRLRTALTAAGGACLAAAAFA